MDHSGVDGVASSSTAHLATTDTPTPPTAAAAGTAAQRKEARGRKRNDDLPPSRAREVQRAFRARRAAHLAALEERVKEVEAENAVLRKQLNLPPANREPIRAGPTGRGKILDPTSAASSVSAGGAAKRRAGAANDDDYDSDGGIQSADDSEAGSSARPLKRQASELARASPASSSHHPHPHPQLAHHQPSPSAGPVDFGSAAGGGGRNPSIDPPGTTHRSFTPTLAAGSVPIHLTSPFPSASAGSPSALDAHQQQQQRSQAALLTGLASSGLPLPPMTDDQIFFYQQHLAQQAQQGKGGSPALGHSFGGGGGGFGQNNAGNLYGHGGMVSHHSPLNNSFELLQQQAQQQQQQLQQQQQQQQQFVQQQQQQQQHYPLASLLSMTTPQTASSPYTSFSPSSFGSSFPGSGSGLGGAHAAALQAAGLRSHASSPHSTHSSGLGPTPPAARPSFNETDAMFRLRMCCKLDDRLVSNDPGCLAFCQAVVSALGVTHADCLALPEPDDGPLLAGADSPASNNGLGGGGGNGNGGVFDPTTPRSPNGKHNGGVGGQQRVRYVPILHVWSVLRPLFPLGPDGGIREAMEAGTRAARYLVRSAQDEARSFARAPAGAQQATSSGKPWACAEWIQCRSSNGVEVQGPFLQSLVDRAADHAARTAKATSSLSTPQTEPSPASTQPSPSNGQQNGGPATTQNGARPGSDDEKPAVGADGSLLSNTGGGPSALTAYGIPS